MLYFVLLPGFSILTSSSLLIHHNITWTISRYSLVVLKRIFIVWSPLSDLSTRNEVVDLDNLCRWAAWRLVNDLIVGWSWAEAWFLLMERNSLAPTWAWSNLLTYSWPQSLISSRWRSWNIDRSSLSSPRLAWSPTTRVAIFTMCGDITWNRPSSHVWKHLFSVHLCNLLHKFVHHLFVLHNFSNIYDLALFEVFKDET